MTNRGYKKPLIVAAALLGLLTFSGGKAMAATDSAIAPVPAVTQAQVQSLAQGATGPAVGRLQQQLKTLGYFDYDDITGYFGPITAAALREFQAGYGLPVTGMVNSATQQALGRAVTMQQLMWDTATYTGVPYLWGGESPDAGFDCSGFVYFMYKTHRLPLDRLTSEAYFTMGTPVDRAHLQPGDLVFFHTHGTASHVGFYMGGGKWVSATSSRGIWTYTLGNGYWGPKYDGARRI